MAGRHQTLCSVLLSAALLAVGHATAQPEHPERPPATGGTSAPLYKPDRGPERVVTDRSIILHDPDRDKDLELLIRYPAAPAGRGLSGPCPLVLFSHGMGGSREGFSEFGSHLASWGYVVIHCTHSDSVELRRRQGEKVTRESFLRKGVRQVDPLDRVQDVTLILDRLDEIESRVAGLRSGTGEGRISRTQIAMAGHSAGALTTQMVAGVRNRFGPLGPGGRWGDPRIRAFVPISGQGRGVIGLNEDSWKPVTIPMLTVTGSLDTAAVGKETPESRRHPFEFSTPTGRKHLLWVEGARHNSWQSPAPAERPTVLAFHSAVTAFLDANLKNDPEASGWLNTPSNHRDVGTAGTATLRTK